MYFYVKNSYVFTFLCFRECSNIPSTEQQVPPTKPKRVTFDTTSEPPREIPPPNKVFNNEHPALRVPNKMPTPRVSSSLPIITEVIINKPILNNPINSKTQKARKRPLFERTKLQQKINESKNSRARITQQTHMRIRQQKYFERAQLDCNNKMGEYLNYRQLI